MGMCNWCGVHMGEHRDGVLVICSSCADEYNSKKIKAKGARTSYASIDSKNLGGRQIYYVTCTYPRTKLQK